MSAKKKKKISAAQVIDICTPTFASVHLLTHFSNIQNISSSPPPLYPFHFLLFLPSPPPFVCLFLSFPSSSFSVFSSVTLEHAHTHTHTHTHMYRPACTLPRIHITSQAAYRKVHPGSPSRPMTVSHTWKKP